MVRCSPSLEFSQSSNIMLKTLKWCVHDNWCCYNDIVGEILADRYSWTVFSVFSIWKSLLVLLKARIKILARCIYTYRFFFLYMHSLLLENKKLKKFLWLLFSMFNYIYYETILVWGLVSIWLANVTHCKV